MSKKRRRGSGGGPRPRPSTSGARSSGARGGGPRQASGRPKSLRDLETATGPDDGAQDLAAEEPDDELEPAATSTGRPAQRRSTRPSGTRRASAQPPPGVFGGLRAASPYPRFGQTMVRGLGAVLRSPLLVLLPLLIVGALWFALDLAALDHVPTGIVDLLAVPPMSMLFDLNLGFAEIGVLSPASFPIVIGLVLVHGVVYAILTGLVLQSLEGDRPSRAGVFRGLLVLPTVLAVTGVYASGLFIVYVLGPSLGGLGQFIFIGGVIALLYLFVFAPIIAVRDRLHARDALGRSARAARLPGSRHFGLVFLYFFVCYVPFTALSVGPFVDAPSFTAWVVILAATLVHVVFLAAFAYRYLAVEDEIPDAPPKRPRGAAARSSRAPASRSSRTSASRTTRTSARSSSSSRRRR